MSNECKTEAREESPTRRELIVKEKAYVQYVAEPYKSFKLLQALQNVRIVNHRLLFESKTGNLFYNLFKLIFSMATLFTLLGIYLNTTQVYLSTVAFTGLIETQLIFVLLSRMIVNCRKESGSFFNSEFVSRYLVAVQITFFISNVVVCLMYSYNKPVRYIWVLALFDLLLEGIELVIFMIMMGVSIGFAFALTGEFLCRLFRCKIKCQKQQQITVTVYPHDSSTAQLNCIVCQEAIVEGDRICLFNCGCKAEYHKVCIVAWYDKMRKCPSCKTPTTIK